MQGQSNNTPQTTQGQPSETQVQAPRPVTGLTVKTHVKAGQSTVAILD